MSQERRRHARIRVACPVVVTRDGVRVEGQTFDVSLGGVGVEVAVDPPWALGQEVVLEITLPGLGEPARVPAVVRWVDDIAPFRAGTQFRTGLRAREVWAINQLFRRAGS